MKDVSGVVQDFRITEGRARHLVAGHSVVWFLHRYSSILSLIQQTLFHICVYRFLFGVFCFFL